MARRPRSTGAEADGWADLRRFTPARIALGRAGGSLPTAPHLAFQLAHARARDAVHAALDVAGVTREIAALGHEVIAAASRAADRATYLQRPDLGRRLSEASRQRLADWHAAAGGDGAGAPGAPGRRRFDAAIVVADGLSALAVARNAVPLIAALGAALAASADGTWSLAPVVVATEARVAIGDEIGAILGARLVAVLIGERPGLSAPDSLGAYLTFGPAIGRTDAERNCISNIRDGGLAPVAAAGTLAWLMGEARRRGLTGIGLKDETAPPAVGTGARNFLLDNGKSDDGDDEQDRTGAQ